jgi:GntR family transcriptional repressor for pyruvate dehydrogenase complex
LKKHNLSKKNLSDLVVAKIRSYIEDNHLKVGDRLPTEQEICETYGVSRVSVREATKALSFLGIIEAAPRRGLTVGPFNMERVAEILGFHFLIDNYSKEMLLKTRMVIEIGSLEYAMEPIRNDEKTYKKLLSLCNKIDQTNNRDEYLKLDAEFHRTLLQTGGVDPILSFNDVVTSFFSKFRTEITAIDDLGLKKGAEIHRNIIESLHNGDLIEAENFLRFHLSSVGKILHQTKKSNHQATKS